jgi:hypothetical protein
MTAFFGGTVFACWSMRKMKARWPGMGPGRLIAGCFAVMIVFDFVIEGCIWIPLGFYTYAGGHLSLWPDSYHKFPLHETLFASALWTGFAILRYFKNDKGETLAERGVSKLNVGVGRKTALRFLALLAAMSAVFNFMFNIPIALFIAPQSATWPKAIQERSYLTDRICGAGTDRICPGPGIPNFRGSQTAHVNPNGQLVVPAGVNLPRPVGFAHNNKIHPYSGPLVGSTKRP